MSPAAYAKAIVAALIAGVAPAATQGVLDGHVTLAGVVASVVSALAGGGATYVTKNASSLVVELRTDAEVFLKTFLDGVPALVGQAAKAAVQPKTPEVPAPTTPPAA